MAARGGASGRDAALARLCAASDAYHELSDNLREGVKFYNDLTQVRSWRPRALARVASFAYDQTVVTDWLLLIAK